MSSTRQKDKEKLWHLRKLIQKFENLDSALIESLGTEKDSLPFEQTFEQTREAKKEIKKFLAEKKGAINVNQKLAEKLKKIRDNYDYNIDKLCALVEKQTGRRFSQEAEDTIDWFNTLFDVQTANYNDDIVAYIDEAFNRRSGEDRRRNEIGSIIITQSLPDAFLQHLERLKECYVLGLFEATIIFCRALIEAGALETLKRRGKIRAGRNGVVDIAKYRLCELMKRLEPFVYRYNYNAAWKVITFANSVVHPQDDKISVPEEEAYNSIKSSFAFIEDLFR